MHMLYSRMAATHLTIPTARGLQMTFYRAFSILLTNASHTGLPACILSFTIVAGSSLVHTSELEGGAHQKKGEVACRQACDCRDNITC